MLSSFLSALALPPPIKTHPTIKSIQITLGHVRQKQGLCTPLYRYLYYPHSSPLSILEGIALLPGSYCGVALLRPADPEPQDTEA
jgi:hypothetical protein